MGNVVFYKDSDDLFKCGITLEGASLSTAKTRLILEFSTKTLLFNGSIDAGAVSVKIPRLSEVEDSHGRAGLEVIADLGVFVLDPHPS